MRWLGCHEPSSKLNFMVEILKLQFLSASCGDFNIRCLNLINQQGVPPRKKNNRALRALDFGLSPSILLGVFETCILLRIQHTQLSSTSEFSKGCRQRKTGFLPGVKSPNPIIFHRPSLFEYNIGTSWKVLLYVWNRLSLNVL